MIDLRSYSAEALAFAHKQGGITSEELEAEITRRTALSLGGVLRRFVRKVNDIGTGTEAPAPRRGL